MDGSDVARRAERSWEHTLVMVPPRSAEPHARADWRLWEQTRCSSRDEKSGSGMPDIVATEFMGRTDAYHLEGMPGFTCIKLEFVAEATLHTASKGNAVSITDSHQVLGSAPDNMGEPT
jgi:hypothetical protein